MIGNPDKNDRVFSEDNYEKFYENHYFEPIPDDLYTTVNEVIPRFGWAFDKISDIKPKTLLDLACLDGSFAISVCNQLGVDVTGIDLTKDGINLANKRSTSLGTKATFFQGTIEGWLEKFSKEGNKFDVVTLFEIIEHVKDPQLVLKLIDKVLAPGGSVLVSTPDFEAPTYGADDEDNKCHLRLYTTSDEDYERPNKYGTVRKATSISKEIGKDRIKEMVVFNELINILYQ